MEIVKCICNDSRGTDCDYCGGSGWRTRSIHLDTTNSKNILSNSEKSSDISIANGEAKKIPKAIILRLHSTKSFDQRLLEIKDEIQSVEKIKRSEFRQSIEYIKKRIFNLIEDTFYLRKKQTNKQIKYLTHVKLKIDEIVMLFNLSIKKYARKSDEIKI